MSYQVRSIQPLPVIAEVNNFVILNRREKENSFMSIQSFQSGQFCVIHVFVKNLQ